MVSQKNGVFVIVLNSSNKILFYEEQKEFGFGKLRLPGGDVEEFDLNVFAAAKRELMEEFGVEIDIIKDLGFLICDYNGVSYKNNLILANLIGDELKPDLKEKVANPVWLSVEEYNEIPIENTFLDMKRAIVELKRSRELK